MTEETLLLVKELKEKIRLLFSGFEDLERRNEELKKEIVSLKERIQLLEEDRRALITKYENLKLARTIESGYGDNRMVRQKIGRLMREIDKCVALLNE